LDIPVTILIMLICLAAEAFFSGSEIGVVSADRMQLRHKAAQGSRGARLALVMLEKPEWLLSTTLVGTNISVVTNTTMATALMIHLFGEQYLRRDRSQERVPAAGRRDYARGHIRDPRRLLPVPSNTRPL
jgi:CBS domain containing-hemolysin-like protein